MMWATHTGVCVMHNWHSWVWLCPFTPCYRLNCISPKMHPLRSKPPVPQKITLFSNKVFKEVIKLNVRAGP